MTQYILVVEKLKDIELTDIFIASLFKSGSEGTELYVATRIGKDRAIDACVNGYGIDKDDCWIYQE